MRGTSQKTASQITEARKKARVASRYRREGYAVERDVPMGDGLHADIVAQKTDETIVIAVKSWESLYEDRGRTAELARQLAGKPNVRFDLVMTAPRKKRKTAGARAR